MKIWKPHPAALVMPPMKSEEMADLKRSILERGQLFPAVLLDGKLLDGRNRQEAIRQLIAEKRIAPTTELKVVEWNGGGETPAGFVDAANDKRRHLNASQRAMVAQRLLPYFRKEAKARQAAAARETNRKRRGGQKSLKLDGPRVRSARAAAEAVTKAAGAAGGKVSARTVQRAEYIAKNDPVLARKVFEGELTVKQAEKKLRRQKQDKQVAAYVPPAGKFQVVTVDFSWEYADKLDGANMERELPYPTMTPAEIRAFVREKLAPCCDEVCLLGCWVTNTIMLDLETWPGVQAEIEKLGFRPMKLQTWRKTSADGDPVTGLGNGVRNDSEQFVLFARGPVVWSEMGEAHGNPIQRTVFDAPRGANSEKPDEAYRRLERLVPYTSRLEMFARKPRAGWTTSGAELALPPASGDSAPAGAAGPNRTSAPQGASSFPNPAAPVLVSGDPDAPAPTWPTQAAAEAVLDRAEVNALNAGPVDFKAFTEPKPTPESVAAVPDVDIPF